MCEQWKVKRPEWFSHSGECLYGAVWESKCATMLLVMRQRNHLENV